jgi:hypothetical protein
MSVTAILLAVSGASTIALGVFLLVLAKRRHGQPLALAAVTRVVVLISIGLLALVAACWASGRRGCLILVAAVLVIDTIGRLIAGRRDKQIPTPSQR